MNIHTGVWIQLILIYYKNKQNSISIVTLIADHCPLVIDLESIDTEKY